MLLPTVLCVWLNVTANLGIPCTWISEYPTIANRGVDASGAVMHVCNCLPPNDTTCSCCYRWKENTGQVGSATSEGESRDTSNCTVQFRDDKVHLSFTLAKRNA